MKTIITGLLLALAAATATATALFADGSSLTFPKGLAVTSAFLGALAGVFHPQPAKPPAD